MTAVLSHKFLCPWETT